MRIVLDTNIWVSGLLWMGPSWHVLRLAQDGSVEICIANSMLLELAEVLDYPRLQPRLQTLGETSDQLTAFALSISSPYDVSRSSLPIVANDPDDDIFLLCAVAADAAYVVSADRHLLRMEMFKGIPIVTVEEFLRREFPESLEGQEPPRKP